MKQITKADVQRICSLSPEQIGKEMQETQSRDMPGIARSIAVQNLAGDKTNTDPLKMGQGAFLQGVWVGMKFAELNQGPTLKLVYDGEAEGRNHDR